SDTAENGIDLKGSCHIVVEGNVISGTRGDSDGCLHLLGQGVCDRSAPGAISHGSHARSTEIIVRRNVMFDTNGGILAPDALWMVYNNTITNVNRDYTGPNSTYLDVYDRPNFLAISASAGDYVKNNLVGNSNTVEIALNDHLQLEIDGNIYF